MLTIIFTKSIADGIGYQVIKTEYIDFIKTGISRNVYLTDNKDTADVYNIGTSLSYLIEQDKKFGVSINIEAQASTGDKQYKQIKTKQKYVIYKGTNIKRFAFVITDNEKVYKSISYSMREFDYFTTRMINRIIYLKQKHLIKVLFGNESILTSEFIEEMKNEYKD